MEETMSAVSNSAKVSLSQIWQSGAIALIAAVVVNALLFLVGSALGVFPPTALTPMGVPVTIGAVILMSVLGTLVGVIGYTVLSRFLIPANTNRWFTILAIIVIVAMLFSPFGIQNAPLAQIVILELMHLVVAGALVYFLTRPAQS
jgi:hypothetical protein